MTKEERQTSLRVSRVLADAQEDLKHADFPWIFGSIFNPVREAILLPSVRYATEVIEVVISHVPVPYTDEVCASFIKATVDVIKFGYGLLPHEDMAEISKAEFTKTLYDNEERLARRRKEIFAKNFSDSSLLGLWGFGMNTVIDILTVPFDRKLPGMVECVNKLLAYMIYTGIDKELEKAFLNPRAINNILIVARVQEALDGISSPYSRRKRTALDKCPLSKQQLTILIQSAVHYGRYATAAYGVLMIRSGGVKRTKSSRKVLSTADICMVSAARTLRKRQVARYIGVAENDIISMSNVGGSMNVLNHMIVIDRQNKAVVLAIRGTYSVSDMLIDSSAFTTDFCFGRAHKGIADRVVVLWQNAQQTILNQLKLNPGYALIITGHSLGAGAACLLTIMLYSKKIVAPDLKIKCFAYGPPPVYLQRESNKDVAKAISNTMAFVHENDFVPFLSVHSVRALAGVIHSMDQETSKMNLVSGTLMGLGLLQPTAPMQDIVKKRCDPPDIIDADTVAIPVPFVIWLHKDENSGTCKMSYCRPHSQGSKDGLADLSIFVNRDMVNDHMSPEYEKVIRCIASQLEKDQMIIKQVEDADG